MIFSHLPLCCLAAGVTLATHATSARAQNAIPTPGAIVIRVEGARALPERLLQETIRAAIGSKMPDRAAIRTASDAVTALYARRGYTLARVTDASVDGDIFTLTVVEGRIRQVLILGNARTRAATIRDALFSRPGDTYHEPSIRADRDRLARLGIFVDVSIAPRGIGAPETLEPPPTNDPDTQKKRKPVSLPPPPDEIGVVDLLIQVRESQTGTIAATVGYGDVTGFLGFVSLSESNLFGSAQRGVLEWQRFARIFTNDDGFLDQDEPRSAFFLGFQRPALGPGGIAIDASLYDQNTIFLPAFGNGFETIRSYELRKGASMRVGKALNRTVSGFVTARRDLVNYDPIPDRLNPPIDELARAKATVGGIGLELVADRRDRNDNPARGFLYRLKHEQAGVVFGGDRKFSLSSIDLRQYARLGAAPTISSRNRGNQGITLAGRVMVGTSTGEVPLSEQYFLGGFDLLRGYDVFSIRGDRMFLTSAEGRVPLGDGLSGVVFIDYGGAWRPGERLSASNLRAGVGVGLRFASPIGPIRFDVAYGSRLQTYLTLGQSF